MTDPNRSAYFALWSWSDDFAHEVLVAVYDNDRRARLCAEISGCKVRPVCAQDLQDYLAWRMTKHPEDCTHDPTVSLYLHDSAPILRLSALLDYIEAR